MNITLDQALDTVLALPIDQQEMLVEIVNRRQIERRRHEIATDAAVARAMFLEGKLKPLSVQQAIRQLQQKIP